MIDENELSTFFAGLQPAVEIARRAQEEMDRRAATKFSVLDLFRSHSEGRVRETHLSRIFAGLLDPLGTHGQGDRFLSLFLKDLKETLPGDFSCLDLAGGGTVHLEYSTHEGRRIDIVLEMPENHWIGIENKPWGEEGERQVLDYLEYLQGKIKNRGTAWILYLSGDGREPQTLELSHELQKCCKTIPYRKNSNGCSVEGWIEQCWRECEAERVRWFLQDLVEYIRRKFNKEEQVMGQDVTDKTTVHFILRSNNLALALQVEKAMPEVRNQLITEIKGHLEKWCIEEDWEVFDITDKRINFGLKRKDSCADIICVSFEDEPGRLKVTLSENEKLKEFQQEFDKQINDCTNKFAQFNLIQKSYDLFGTDFQGKSISKDGIVAELTEKMKCWATAVDKVVSHLKLNEAENR